MVLLATEPATKLLLALLVGSPAVLGSGTYLRIFCAIVLSRDPGITLPGNSVRLPLESTLRGSYTRIGNRCPAWVVNDWLKSPPRSSAVGTVRVLPVRGSIVCVRSYEKKKNVFCRPLYTLGIHTGPPKVPPGSLKCTGGLTPFTRFVWKIGRAHV